MLFIKGKLDSEEDLQLIKKHKKTITNPPYLANNHHFTATVPAPTAFYYFQNVEIPRRKSRDEPCWSNTIEPMARYFFFIYSISVVEYLSTLIGPRSANLLGKSKRLHSMHS